MSSHIKNLLKNSQIFQGSQGSINRSAMSTGYALLDQQLHYSGWPQGAISELLLSHHGIGELRLLAPLLAKLSQKPGYNTWINPPFTPYAPALANLNIALDKMIVIRAQTLQESIWAAQQSLASNACSAVLLWLANKTLSKEIRKLSLAAKKGQCWGIIFRGLIMQQQPSAAALRIAMLPQGLQHKLSIIKQPGGWSGQELCFDLFPERKNWTAQTVNQWPTLHSSLVAPKREDKGTDISTFTLTSNQTTKPTTSVFH